MSGSARLRELLAATTPGPWSSAGTHVHRGERFTETHEPIAVAHTEEADASLIALAPELASIVVDLLDNVAICTNYLGAFADNPRGDGCTEAAPCDACQLRARVEGLGSGGTSPAS